MSSAWGVVGPLLGAAASMYASKQGRRLLYDSSPHTSVVVGPAASALAEFHVARTCAYCNTKRADITTNCRNCGAVEVLTT